MADKFESKSKELSIAIEKMKAENADLSYIECTVTVCQKYDIEMESVKKVLSKNIKEKIEMEASDLNLLKYRLNTL